jgi:hypothetical protein
VHTLSTRVLSALAYDRGEEHDRAEPPCPTLLDDLALAELAAPVIGEEGAYDRRRRAERDRRRRQAIPEWFSAEDLIATPWEGARELLVRTESSHTARATDVVAPSRNRQLEEQPMSKQPDVMFTEPNEFVAEIVRDHARGLIERGIVRGTKVARQRYSPQRRSSSSEM